MLIPQELQLSPLGGRFSLKTWGNLKSCFGFKRKLIKVAFTHCMY